MSKFSRNDLKDLVKECLVEILSEGIGHSSSLSERLVRTSSPRPAPIPPRSQSSALNSISYGKIPTKTPARSAPAAAPKSTKAVAESIMSITSDPVMSEIFSDTASTTLQEQLHADSAPGRASASETAAPGQDISAIDIFSDGAKNWATLAFSDAPKKR